MGCISLGLLLSRSDSISVWPSLRSKGTPVAVADTLGDDTARGTDVDAGGLDCVTAYINAIAMHCECIALPACPIVAVRPVSVIEDLHDANPVTSLSKDSEEKIGIPCSSNASLAQIQRI